MLKEEAVLAVAHKEMSVKEVNKLLEQKMKESGIEELFEFIGDKEFVRNIAVGLTQFAFRSGPVEDMHAGIDFREAEPGTDPEDISQLSNADMKKLNTYMVNKIGFVVHLLTEKRYFELAMLLNFYIQLGSHWDAPDIKKEEKEFEPIISRFESL